MIIAEIHCKLLRAQAKFPRILSQNGQNDLECLGRWPANSIPVESILGSMFVTNLVIVAQIHHNLLHGQAKFPRILSQNCQKWPWRSRSMTPIFNTNRENLKVIVQTSQISKNYESNWPEWPSSSRRWPSISIPTKSILGCMFGANLMIVTEIHYKLLHGQARFPRIRSQIGQTDLQGQGRWPSNSIPAESILRCMFGANLVIVAQIYNKLLRGQAKFPKILS